MLESLITPEHFAEVLCEDLQFPVHQFAPHISRSIREQIQDYHLPALSVAEIPVVEQQDPLTLDEARSAQELRILIKVPHKLCRPHLVKWSGCRERRGSLTLYFIFLNPYNGN